MAGAARKVLEEIEAVLGRSAGWRLQGTRQRLSESLGCALGPSEFASVAAEVAALAWVEGGGKTVRLLGPLEPLEAFFERPGSSGLEAALEGLRSVAVRLGGEAEPPESLYEEFLAELDPETRTRHSVYLTPAPLVRMLVGSVHELLADHLGIAGGLASPEVGLLDPAAGTGAFLLEALRRGERRDLLPRSAALWQGFEVQPGAYVAATLRLARWLGEGAPPASHRVRLGLADVLAPDSPLGGPRESKWGEPAPEALVVLGNPPWSDTGPSSAWVDRLLRTGYLRPNGSRDDGYYRSGGEGIASSNTKWLQARYVKFLRLAQWSVDQVGRGVAALVLSDGIAENLTMSGVRESLLGSFESIYLLDLGGSARKVACQGADDNLFEIQQGACALILVKGGARRGVVTHELRGRRSEKLAWLGGRTVSSIPWRESRPRPPGYSFLARGSWHLDRYWSALSIPEIFERGSIAVITGRDRLVVGFEEEDLLARIGLLRQGRDPAAFGLRRSAGFDPEEALRSLAEDEGWERRVVPYLVRPGDRRVLFAAPYLVGRLRESVMGEVRRPGNVALLVPRRRRVFPSAWVTDTTASHRVACAYEGSYAFPLYMGAERRPNISGPLLDELASRYGSPPAPEDVFGYVYGLLWDAVFHERYCDGLREDWPRLGFPEKFEDFIARAGLGWTLVQVHLGLERASERPRFEGELPVRLPERGRTFHHDSEERIDLGIGGCSLAPVGREAMAFTVGGYAVVPGWIRRRAGRRLEANDIESLCQLVETIDATRRIESELAELED